MSASNRRDAANRKRIMTDEQIKFLKSFDFMRLGHAIEAGNWQAVAMATRRMALSAKNCELNEFERWFTGIRQCAMSHNRQEALSLMVLVTNKRVKYLNSLSQTDETR